MAYEFVKEESNISKLKSFFTTIFILVFLLVISVLFFTIWYSFVEKIPILNTMVAVMKNDIARVNPRGIFYAHFIGGLFFVPSADELIFYFGIVKQNPIPLMFLLAIGGYMLAQLFNYYVGYKSSRHFINLISKKHLYKSRRFVNKYGSYGLFLFNLLPFPAPTLTFALGITKYNFYRLMFFTLLCKITKYILVIVFYFNVIA